MPEWLEPDTIISWLGPWALIGVLVIVFAECGLLVGFFLPGDSLLFTTGLFVAQGAIDSPLWLVCTLLVVAAIAGNACGYYIGRAAGPAIFDRPKSRLFKPEHVVRTREFFDKYGNRAIVLARFVPIVRTFITVMAGVARMDPRRYFTYSVIGGVAWAAGVTVLGYFLGQVTFVRDNIELIALLIVVVSVVPIIVELVQNRRKRAKNTADDATEATMVLPRAAREGRPSALPPRAAAPQPGPADVGSSFGQHPGGELNGQVGFGHSGPGVARRPSPVRREHGPSTRVQPPVPGGGRGGPQDPYGVRG